MFEFIESLFESIILLILVYYIVYINNKTKKTQKDNLPLLNLNFVEKNLKKRRKLKFNKNDIDHFQIPKINNKKFSKCCY